MNEMDESMIKLRDTVLFNFKLLINWQLIDSRGVASLKTKHVKNIENVYQNPYLTVSNHNQ